MARTHGVPETVEKFWWLLHPAEAPSDRSAMQALYTWWRAGLASWRRMR